MAKLVLEDLLVVEFGTAASLCGRILADGGATVVLIENAESGDCRLSDVGTDDYSFRFYNGGKARLASSDLSEQMYWELLSKADVVLDGESDIIGPFVDPSKFASVNKRGILLTIRPYGLDGPYSRCPGTDLTAFACGGVMYVSGKAEGPPVVGPGRPAFDIASLEGTVGLLVALYDRGISGLGQSITISAQEALASLEHQITRSSFEGAAPPRRGSRHESVVPARIYKCADGWIQIFITAREGAWEQFCIWLGSPAELSESDWSDPIYRREHSTVVDRVIENCVLSRSKAELSESALAKHIPCYPVNSVSEYLADSQTLFRELFKNTSGSADRSEVQLRLPPKSDPELLVSRMPIAEYLDIDGLIKILNATPQDHLQQHESKIQDRIVGSLPLDGLRVVDMTQAVAGPFSTRFLADFGADVVKLESYSRPDGFRTRDGGGGKFATSRIFADLNRNKRGMAFDLKIESEYEAAIAVIKNADILFENFAPGVLERLGLSWNVLHALNPKLILIRLSGLGQSGPKSRAPAWGLNMQAFCGMTYLWNLPGDTEPTGTQTSISDYLLGFWGAISGLLSVLAIKKGVLKEGIMVDVAQAEAGAVFIGEFILASAEGNNCRPQGNSKGSSIPMGVFRLNGNDRWCAIEIRNDHDWRVFSRLLNLNRSIPDIENWLFELRVKNSGLIESVVGTVLAEREWEEMPDELKEKVPISLVHDGMDLLRCPQLNACGFIVEIPQTGLETVRYPGIVIKLSSTPAKIRRRSPLLGEHTSEVLKEWVTQ